MGTVTFVFTDIEGSTRLLEELGSDRYGELLVQHHRVCRAAWVEHGGVEVDTAGDAFFVAFPTASGALAAAAEAQLALAELGCVCGWGCTQVRCQSTRRATWALKCIGQRGSRRRRTAARWSYQRRRRRSSVRTGYWISGSRGSRI